MEALLVNLIDKKSEEGVSIGFFQSKEVTMIGEVTLREICC